MKAYTAIFSALTFVAGIGTARLLTAPTMAATPNAPPRVVVAIAGGVAPAGHQAVCLPGFSAKPNWYFEQSPYTCTSVPVTCPSGLALNSDSAGYKAGAFTYVCAKPS